MKARLIKSEAEYEAALAQVDTLMSALPGSAEAEELELWVHLVETYEDAHYPIPFPAPIEAIRFRMEQQGLKPADLIPYLGNKSKVSEVLSGKRALSLAMIRKLNGGLAIPAEVLLGEPSRSLPPTLAQMDWKAFPLAEMVHRRWFGDAAKSLRDLRERAEEILGPFLTPVAMAPAKASRLRQKVRRNSAVDEKALLAWKARVWHLAQGRQVSPYNPKTITRQFIGEVARLSPLKNGPLVAADILAGAGIRLVVEPPMPHTHLDGAAMRFDGHSPVVALTLRYDRLDNFWFTLCHELAHVALHLQGEESASFLDDLEATDESKGERDADRTASQAMIPETAWVRWREEGTPSRDDIVQFAASIRVHPAIVAGRYRKETGNYKLFSGLIGNRKVRAMFGQTEC